MLAIHPAQVDVINRAFMPTAAELDRAGKKDFAARGTACCVVRKKGM